jgi:hypothetical protein
MARPSTLHPEFLEVELLFDEAEGEVVDLAAVAERDDSVLLSGDDADLNPTPRPPGRRGDRCSPPGARVTRITANVMTRMRFRSGKATGSASAGAREMAPRRPAQPTTNVSRFARRGSYCATTRRGEPGR